MQIIQSKHFTADRAWGALDIANIEGASVRLHWTNQAYQWHVNDGQEVFAVLDGKVRMDYKQHGETHSTLLNAGDVFFAGCGTEHCAHPQSEARILVIEKQGSI